MLTPIPHSLKLLLSLLCSARLNFGLTRHHGAAAQPALVQLQLCVEPPGRGGAGTSNEHPNSCPGTGKEMSKNSVISRTGETWDTLGWFPFHPSPLQHWHQCILGICGHRWAPTGQDIQGADREALMWTCGCCYCSGVCSMSFPRNVSSAVLKCQDDERVTSPDFLWESVPPKTLVVLPLNINPTSVFP